MILRRKKKDIYDCICNFDTFRDLRAHIQDKNS